MSRLWLLALVTACGVEVPEELPHDDPPAQIDDATASRGGMRRLTATHVARALTDLTGVDDDWARGFPPESGGWEGLEAAQPVSPGLIEALDAAADRAVDALLTPLPPTQILHGEDQGWPGVPYDDALTGEEGLWQVDFDGERVLDLWTVAEPGPVDVTLRAAWTLGWVFGGAAPQVSLLVNGQRVGERSLQSEAGVPTRLAWRVDLPAGADVGLYLRAETGGLQAVWLSPVTITGPSRAAPPATLTCHAFGDREAERACGDEIFGSFAARAWRRPVTPEERDRLTALYTDTLDAGATFEQAVAVSLKAVLSSPHFLFRVEDTAALAPGGSREATPHELAARLAVALYASLPDDALRACADAGLLRRDEPGPCGVDAQVERMLADPRADAVVHDFARQWLGLDALDALTRDPVRYPAFTPNMARAMREEVLALVEEVRSARLDPMTLVDAPFAFVTPELAAVYGVPHAAGARVDLPPERRGLLGHAAMLALTAQADRSSPVLRGKYVLDRLLCDPPDPPPDGIPALAEAAVDGDVAAVLAAHRQHPSCATCHDAIDPLGLSMEHFDALGAWRDAYPNGDPVDARGGLPDGTPVAGLAELATGLADDADVRRCFARALATWALERPVGDGSVAAAVAAAPDLDAMRRVLATLPEVATVTAPSPGAP